MACTISVQAYPLPGFKLTAMTMASELEHYLADRKHEGCAESELEMVTSRSPVPLPDDYVTFLRRMGRGAEGFLVGTDYAYPRLLEIQEWAQEMLGEQSPPVGLPPCFAIAMHQGYQFYAITGVGIVYYREGSDDFEIRFPSFQSWFAAMIE